MLASLGAPRKAVVIMDRGIADDANLAWLRSNGYRYLVVSRDNTRIFDAEETRAIMTASLNRVDVYKEVVTKQEKDGTPFTEAHLRCFSEARAEKERSILRRFQERFESGLKKLHEGVAKPRTRKSLDHVQRRVARLLKENTRVARHYNVTITPDQKASKAVSITWTFEPVAGTMMTHPGVYCLRSNVLDWDAETMWKTYITLTDAEAVFRALKSELGLRPIFHQKEHRADGHLFISVLAYQAVQVLHEKGRISRQLDLAAPDPRHPAAHNDHLHTPRRQDTARSQDRDSRCRAARHLPSHGHRISAQKRPQDPDLRPCRQHAKPAA